MALEIYHPGLEGVCVGETNITSLRKGIQYRGYALQQLMQHASFTEVAYLLLYGDLPNEEELADFDAILTDEADLTIPVVDLISDIPLHANMFDVMRTSVGLLHHFDLQANDAEPECHFGQAARLIAKLPSVLAVRHHGQAGANAEVPDEEIGFCGRILKLFTGEDPLPSHERALESFMIARVDDCFSASTFAARIVASTGAPVHASLQAAIGAEQGNASVSQAETLANMMCELDSPQQATTIAVQMIAQQETISGFGHSTFKKWDPRERLLQRECERLAIEQDRVQYEENVEAVERVVWEQRKKRPNVDWASARLLHYLGLEADLHLPMILLARTVGWCAHIIEQHEEQCVYRPLSRYRGAEDLQFVPIDERE